MKIRLSIDLELPPGTEDYSPAELRQMLFDDYVNYVTRKHSEDALNALSTSYQCERDNGGEPCHRSSIWKQISERHTLLAKVFDQPRFELTPEV